jgi:hypothetical protein
MGFEMQTATGLGSACLACSIPYHQDIRVYTTASLSSSVLRTLHPVSLVYIFTYLEGVPRWSYVLNCETPGIVLVSRYHGLFLV